MEDSHNGKLYPNIVAEACGISLTTTLSILNKLVNMKKLKLEFEIKQDSKVIAITQDYSGFLGKQMSTSSETLSLDNV